MLSKKEWAELERRKPGGRRGDGSPRTLEGFLRTPGFTSTKTVRPSEGTTLCSWPRTLHNVSLSYLRCNSLKRRTFQDEEQKETNSDHVGGLSGCLRPPATFFCVLALGPLAHRGICLRGTLCCGLSKSGDVVKYSGVKCRCAKKEAQLKKNGREGEEVGSEHQVAATVTCLSRALDGKPRSLVGAPRLQHLLACPPHPFCVLFCPSPFGDLQCIHASPATWCC